MFYSLDAHVIENFSVPQMPLFTFWDDGFTSSELDEIDAMFEKNKGKEFKAYVGSTNKKYDGATRETDISFEYFNPDSEWMYHKIVKIVKTLNTQYYNFDIRSAEPTQFGTYKASNGGHFDWHMDAQTDIVTNNMRKLSIILFMSDPTTYEGGKFQIFVGSKEVDIDTRRGMLLMFPSYLVHRVTPITKGIRRTVVTWCSGPLFK